MDYILSYKLHRRILCVACNTREPAFIAKEFLSFLITFLAGYAQRSVVGFSTIRPMSTVGPKNVPLCHFP